LGQRSNETSGVAIRQRQRQGDVATYHFMDNLSRSIRHGGRVIIDLIQKVKTTAGIIRTLGQDMEPRMVQIGPKGEQPDGMEQVRNIQRIFDLSVGKYDLVVKAGPGFGTQREAAREELVEVIRAFPQAAPVLGPMYLRNSDWPGADDAADKLEAMANPPQQEGLPPELQQQIGQMQQAMQAGQARLQELETENTALKAQWQLKNRELDIKQSEAETKAAEVKVKELSALMAAQQPQAPTPPQGAPPSNPYGLAA
jgi:Skp family chaperone for outer membrane proteins